MEQKNKLLFLAHFGEDFLAYRVNFLNFLKKRGVSCTALVPKDEFNNEVKKCGFPVIFYNYKRSWKFVFYIFFAAIKITKTIKSQNPKYIVTLKFFPNLVGVFIAHLLKVDVKVAIVAGLGFMERKDVSTIVNALFRVYIYVLKKSDFLVVQNHDDFIFFMKYIDKKKIILTNGSGLNKDKILSFKSGINFKEVSSKKIKKILFCSRIVKEKGILELIEAFEKLNNDKVNLTIAGWFDGTGNLENKVREKIRGAKNISFLGYQKKVNELINDHDCVILPSYYPEGVPRILIEALALSKPVITTNHRGCKETCIHEVNGLLVKPRSVTDLIEKIDYFTSLDKTTIENMGKNSFELFEKKFEDKIVFNQIFSRVFSS